MDAFESIIATILEQDGFWVRTTYKVELSKEEKHRIGRPSSPRWELDVVGYRPGDNRLQIVECKSYLDSRGVRLAGFDPNKSSAKRYKLFNEPVTREVVFAALLRQLREEKAIHRKPKVELCLAAGKIVKSDRSQLHEHFQENGWLLYDRDWIVSQLHEVADSKYDNAIAAVTAKLLLRE